jgi:1,4-dihydroxy-2-naphthoate octaprenyltransferase
MNAARVWLLAIRPATLTAALGPVAVGSALAFSDGFFDVWPALAALLGAVLIQIGTNLFNDWADFAKGADTDERLGPPRAVQRGWLTPRQVLSGAVVSFALAIAVGGYLVWHAGWPLVVIGLLSVICGVLYTGGPAPLAYTGLGDPFVMAFFGVVAVCGTYFVQAMSLTPAVVVASLAVGALATAILVVNNLRDRDTDRLASKRTLVVRFGERFGRVEYVALLLFAYAVPVIALLMGGSYGWLLPLPTLPLALRRIRRVTTMDGAALNAELAATAQLGLVFNLLLATGVML